MRVWYTILVLAMTITMPFWIYLPLIFIGIIMFPFYIESVFLGLLVDVIYGGAIDNILFGFPFGLAGAVLTLSAIPLRKRLRFNT